MSSPALLILFLSTVVSRTAINQLSSSASLCLRIRTMIMSLIGWTVVVFQFSSVLCQQLSDPKDASSVLLVPVDILCTMSPPSNKNTKRQL